MPRWIAILAIVGVLGGCSEDGGNSANRPKKTVTTAEKTTTTARRDSAHSIGDSATFEDGAKFTVHQYLQPVPPADEYITPDPGMDFAAVDFEACGGTTGETSYNPFHLELAMPDHTRRTHSVFGPKEPSLSSGELANGECVRGWVSFDVPTGSRPESVYVKVLGYSTQIWTVPGVGQTHGN